MLIGGQSNGGSATVRFRTEAKRYLAVGDHVVDTDTLKLMSRPDARLTPKAAAVLLQLARAEGRTLSRDELLDEVWKGTCPTPDVLTQAVKDLRRALGDDLNAPRYVETVPRLGYRLVASARFLDDDESGAPEPEPARAMPEADSSMLPRIAMSVAVVLALIALAIVAIRKDPANAASGTRWKAEDRRSVTTDPGSECYPQISPDGTRITYSIDADIKKGRIAQRSLAQSRVLRLTDSADGSETYPIFSPDGATIAFARYGGDRCDILTAPALGGVERLIGACAVRGANPYSWTPDGKHLITSGPSDSAANDLALRLLSTEGGEIDRLKYEHGREDLDYEPRYSPDGRSIAFRRGANPYSDLFVVDAGGGRVRQLTHLASRILGFDWTRDGSALVFSSGHAGEQALYAVTLDDARVESLGVQPAEYPSASRATDTVVYEIPRRRTQIATIALDGAQARGDLAPSTGSDRAPTFSPVDGRVAFVSDRSGFQQLWMYDPKTEEAVALLDAPEPNLRYPVWRSDGAKILIAARGADSGSLIEVDIATRTHRVLTAAGEDVRYGVFGPRPNTYIVMLGRRGQSRELVEIENDGSGEASRRVLVSDVSRVDYDAANSIVYLTKRSEPGFFRLDPASGAVVVVNQSIATARLDGWTVSDGQIFYVASSTVGPSEIRVVDPATAEDRPVATIAEPMADVNFSVSHDRRSVAIVRIAAQDADIGSITLKRDRG